MTGDRWDSVAPRQSWPEFLDSFRWRQGEHVTLIGPTGCGKTTLALALLPLRAYVTAIGTKPEDKTLAHLVKREHWRRIESWPPPPITGRQARIVLWPKYRYEDRGYAQAVAIQQALGQMFHAGGWTVFADELYQLCRKLGLTADLEEWWTQGRSIGLTIVGATQRPAHVPLLAYDQATHLFLWRDNDEANLRRVAGLGGVSGGTIRQIVQELPRHVCLYVNTRDGQLRRTVAPRTGG